MKKIYIAGPYTGSTHDHRSYFEIDRHIKQAEEAAVALANAGVGFFCPHTHSAHFEILAPDVKPDFWYALDIDFLEQCDAILMLPGWQRSKGCLREFNFAIDHGLWTFYDTEDAINWGLMQ